MGLIRVFTYKEHNGKQVMEKENSLWDALGLCWQNHMIISFTGGGGKTSAMFALADELAKKGKHVIVTTSTHIFCPEDRIVVPAGQVQTVKDFIDSHGEFSSGPGWVLVTGQPAPEGKLKGMPVWDMEQLAGLGDVLLIEADGAKRLPLKIPKEGEPVIVKNTYAVIGCAGLDCIGRPWKEQCFRWELAGKIFGWQIEKQLITPAQAAQVLISTRGTRKDAEFMEYRILLNKADDEGRQSAAVKVINAMGKEWAGRCVVTSLIDSKI